MQFNGTLAAALAAALPLAVPGLPVGCLGGGAAPATAQLEPENPLPCHWRASQLAIKLERFRQSIAGTGRTLQPKVYVTLELPVYRYSRWTDAQVISKHKSTTNTNCSTTNCVNQIKQLRPCLMVMLCLRRRSSKIAARLQKVVCSI